MSAYALVAVLTIGGLLSFTSAADARRQVRRTIGATPRPGMNFRASKDARTGKHWTDRVSPSGGKPVSNETVVNLKAPPGGIA